MQKWIVLDIIWLVTALLSVSLYLIIEKQVDVSLEWTIIHLNRMLCCDLITDYPNSWLSVRLQLQFVRKQTWLFLNTKANIYFHY